MTAPYFVHGVELVNCGGEKCCACDRPAVGYTNAHPICATHAGMAAVMADEYAREREAGQARREAKMGIAAIKMEPTTPPAAASESRKRSLTIHNARKATDARETRHRLVMTALGDTGRPMTVLEIRDRTRISEHTVRMALNELVREQRVTVVNARAPKTARTPRRERLVYSVAESQ